jgi:hypothetical protein
MGVGVERRPLLATPRLGQGVHMLRIQRMLAYVALRDDANLGRGDPSHRSRIAIAATREWVMGKQDQINSVFVYPRREWRAGMTDEHREAGMRGGGPK